MTLSALFKQIREDKKVTVSELAKRAGVERSAIYKLEDGSRMPSAKMLRKIGLKGLGLSESSEQWQTLSTHWFQANAAPNLSPTSIAGNLARTFMRNQKEAQDFIERLSSLDEDTIAHLNKAVRRPEVLAALPALNAIYDAK